MTYSKLIERLKAQAEENFADFQRKLIPTKQKILGVRTPTLRKIAKEYLGEVEKIFSFPDEFYEVTFIKLTIISALPYEKFINYVEGCVALIDNWATCDCFKAKCIKNHKRDFLPVLDKIFACKKEFYQRYVLVVLLSEYTEKEYLQTALSYIAQAETQYYYVYMAAAWLTAEILVKHYDFGVDVLKSGVLDIKTHNKAIQKAIESYRLTAEQKEYLSSLKIKNKT